MSNFFLNKYAQMLGESVSGFVPELSFLRVNTLKVSEERCVSRLRDKGVVLTPVSGIPLCYRYESEFSLGSTPEYLLGWYYLQEAASQLPVLALSHVLGDALPESTILDMCAAPGSKTTQLAALMNNSGKVVACDVSHSRAQALCNNLERCGVSNVDVLHKDGLFVSDLGMQFDAVLLDAPCSGNLCIEKNWLKKRQVTDAFECSRSQKRLLEAAFSVCKPGGFVIYSTCSLEPEEDECVVEGCNIVSSGLSVGSPGVSSYKKQVFSSDMSNAVRIWPHRQRMQGFFVAVLKKN